MILIIVGIVLLAIGNGAPVDAWGTLGIFVKLGIGPEKINPESLSELSRQLPEWLDQILDEASESPEVSPSSS